ncbi:MAG TPA: hypothetical protein PLU72_17580, partial [Candidatus Ozemobacteraceae bacterium]|nr:hypothetical protein [Candidatus Ozemobacteraceae bacterium]HQG29031.1 hypothetical protein [Candidatus Ozemobacteraceae bacterium]
QRRWIVDSTLPTPNSEEPKFLGWSLSLSKRQGGVICDKKHDCMKSLNGTRFSVRVPAPFPNDKRELSISAILGEQGVFRIFIHWKGFSFTFS